MTLYSGILANLAHNENPSTLRQIVQQLALKTLPIPPKKSWQGADPPLSAMPGFWSLTLFKLVRVDTKAPSHALTHARRQYHIITITQTWRKPSPMSPSSGTVVSSPRSSTHLVKVKHCQSLFGQVTADRKDSIQFKTKESGSDLTFLSPPSHCFSLQTLPPINSLYKARYWKWMFFQKLICRIYSEPSAWESQRKQKRAVLFECKQLIEETVVSRECQFPILAASNVWYLPSHEQSLTADGAEPRKLRHVATSAHTTSLLCIYLLCFSISLRWICDLRSGYF